MISNITRSVKPHKKMKQNYKCKTDTHMAQTEHHKYSICIPSDCTSAPHIKKRARNGHQKYKSTSKTGDQAISNLQLWILRICHYDIIPDLITPERSCFLLLTLLVRDAIVSKKCSFFEHCSNGGLWISNRSGWLLELLTELTRRLLQLP